MIAGYLGETPLGPLYRCQHTNRVAIGKWMKIVSAVLPQSSIPEAMFDCEEAKNNRKASVAAFNEMDANCNTCKHFIRMHADNKKGSNAASNFVYGNCSNPDAQLDKIPYKRDGYQIMLHVADWMGMPCWEPRE